MGKGSFCIRRILVSRRFYIIFKSRPRNAPFCLLQHTERLHINRVYRIQFCALFGYR